MPNAEYVEIHKIYNWNNKENNSKVIGVSRF